MHGDHLYISDNNFSFQENTKEKTVVMEILVDQLFIGNSLVYHGIKLELWAMETRIVLVVNGQDFILKFLNFCLGLKVKWKIKNMEIYMPHKSCALVLGLYLAIKQDFLRIVLQHGLYCRKVSITLTNALSFCPDNMIFWCGKKFHLFKVWFYYFNVIFLLRVDLIAYYYA